MAKKSDIGLFWDTNNFYFVETSNKTVSSVFSTPFEISKDLPHIDEESTEGIQLSEKLQTSLSENHITTTKLSLSLPTKDIIFRSFVIPWMQTSEVKGVVEFESSKYIPFELEELSYTYHPITVTEKRKRQIVILFVAIRKSILAKYLNILKHTGLFIDSVEPAPLSLVRALSFKKHLPKGKSCAIIETDEFSGRIIIVQNNVPYFVREFQLTLPTEKSKFDAEASEARLFNESRISLDYFKRQNPNTKIDRLIVLSNETKSNVADNLSNYLNISSTVISMKDILGITEDCTTGHTKAMGVSLHDTAPLDANFDLSLKTQEEIEAEESGRNKENYITVLVTLLVWGLLLFLVFNGSHKKISEYKTQIKTHKSELGIYESEHLENIQGKAQETTKKLTEYKKIKTSSEISSYLTLIPQLLPDGVWLSDLSITYVSTTEKLFTPKINIDGYVYLKRKNQQLKLVNKFLNSLKDQPFFSKQFKKIELSSVTRQDYKGFSVIRFIINCN